MTGQVVHTICMDTRDAKKHEDDEGAFSFRIAGDNPRVQAARVALGSLEFPVVQWTIEEEWNRIHFSEGFRLTSKASSFRLFERVDNEEGREHEIGLPPYLNTIKSIMDASDGGTIVTCYEPHRLWMGTEGNSCVLQILEWGDVEIICSAIGRVSLTALHASGRLTFVSENSFRIPGVGCEAADAGFVHVPTYPSPFHLCEALSYVLAHTPTETRYEILYDAVTNRAVLQAAQYPEDAKRLELRLYGSALTRLLGYPSPVHDRLFVRPSANERETTEYDFYTRVNNTSAPPLQLPSEQYAGWHHVELATGWYAPAHRPMCTGPPLRLADEVEHALNRLNFPRVDTIPDKMASGHFLPFADPTGCKHLCTVYTGQYTAESIAAALETEMTRLSARTMPGTLFTVDYDAVEARFTFACEVRDEVGVRPAPFALFLPHPNGIDPSRLGFDPVPLYGRDAYTSARRVRVPSMESELLRPATNLYAVTEIVHQKRLRVEPIARPQLTGLILGYNSETHTLRVRTFAAPVPCAHGLIPGDIVHITASPVANVGLMQMNTVGEWKVEQVPRCPLAPRWGRSGVVVEPDGTTAGFGMPNWEQVDVLFKVRPTFELSSCVGMAVALSVEPQPFNLCFGMQQSVPAKTLGFPEGATQWGIDGSVTSGGSLRVPPFIAPAIHTLDHPDYVLMYLTEGKVGTTLQHRSGGATTMPFAKIVLYPLFREERMLPRDTTLLSGESLAQFTVRFTNPDGSPYHFHGVDFSFSLNFVRNLPSGD